MVADLLAVADAAAAERFHLVGESLGGTIALYAGLRRPDRVASITAISCGHRGSGIANAREWEGLIADHGMGAWSAQMMRHRFHEGALSPERHAWFEAQQARHPPEVVLGLMRMLLAMDLTEELPSLNRPVLLLGSDGSPFVGPAMTAEMHRLLPDSEMQVFAGTRHGLPFSHARQCAAVVADYLARHPARDRMDKPSTAGGRN